jgi:hypothetical protein
MEGRGGLLASFTRFWNDARRDAVWMTAVNLLFALLLISQWLGPLKSLTGDEPHYLVVSHSIVMDGDLDLRDDYNEEVWRRFFVGEKLEPHYAPGVGGQYSTRIIGLGIYLAPFYRLGILAGDIVFWARVGMAVLYALLMINIYLLCRDLGIPRAPAVVAWLFGSFSVPLAFYSYSLYPEVPTALLTVLGLRAMIGWDGSGLLRPLSAGLCLGLLPWLGIKYSVIAAIAVLGCLTVIAAKKNALFLRNAGLLLAGPILAAVLLALYLFLLYGTFSPEVIYTGVGEGAKEPAAFNQQAFAGEVNPAANYVRLALMHFIDQRDGILFYSPIYVIGLAGLLLLLRERREVWLFLVIFAALWFVYILSGWGSGHAPACRPLAAVLWVLVVGLAAAIGRARGGASLALKVVTGTITLAFLVIFVAKNFLVHHQIYAHTAGHGNNLLESIPSALDLTVFFPNLVDTADIHWIATVVGTALVFTLVLFVYRHGREPQTEGAAQPGLVLPALCAGIPLAVFALADWSAEFVPDEQTQGEGREIRLYFKDRSTYGYEPVDAGELPWTAESDEQLRLPGCWVKGEAAAEFDVVLRQRPESLVVGLLSRAAPHVVYLRVEGTLFQINFTKAGWQRVSVPGELAARWQRKALYRCTVTTKSGYRPSDAGAQDDRYLGCRIAFSAIHSDP